MIQKNWTGSWNEEIRNFSLSFKDTIERPTFPTGVLTTGGISLPGIKLSDSFNLTPPLMSMSNKCNLLYLPATLPWLSRTRCVL